MHGTLYLVATPIGNLGDISYRAVQTLETVDFVACEDTRVSRKLFEHLGLKRPLISYHAHNIRQSGEKIVQRLIDGENCALISDAGMPAISDPGEELVVLCAENGIKTVIIPGPCAAVSALSLSALPTGRFTFEGFLSTSTKSRFSHLDALKTESRTMIFYEAPHKLLRTLHDLLNTLGNRKISVSRELTKLHEQTMHTTLEAAIEHFEINAPRGEFVLVIAGHKPAPPTPEDIDSAAEQVEKLQDAGCSLKDAVKQISNDSGISKNILYNFVISQK